MEKKILIVEDEPVNRTMFVELFETAGFKVLSAESSEEALELLANEPCLVMLLDLNLPGVNGVDLCKNIKADFPMAICYAITGYPSLFELADCLEAGFSDYFTKPADMKLLYKAAQEAFEKIERWLKLKDKNKRS